MTLTITIDMDDAAFGDDEESRRREVEHILRHWHHINMAPDNEGQLMDSNGNTVGRWEVGE